MVIIDLCDISSAAGASDSNSRHTAPPINVFDIDIDIVCASVFTLAADIKRLEVFHMKCQRQIAKIRWQDHV